MPELTARPRLTVEEMETLATILHTINMIEEIRGYFPVSERAIVSELEWKFKELAHLTKAREFIRNSSL